MKTPCMEVGDDEAATNYLHRLGYYQLSEYWYPFQIPILIDTQTKYITTKREDNFLPGTKFEDATDLYFFDKQLRLLMIEAIEIIEVAVRVDVAHLLGKHNAFAHHNPELLHGDFTKKTIPRTHSTKYSEWLERYEQKVNCSTDDFVLQYKKKYGLHLPIWMAIELWDFGLLSVFFSGMQVKDKLIIAKGFEVPDWQVMESWLRTLSYAKNITVHHRRLWNKNLIDQPKLTKKGVVPYLDHVIGSTHSISRVYIISCIVTYFLNTICPKSTWPTRLKTLLDGFPNNQHININHMGFPSNWLDHSL